MNVLVQKLIQDHQNIQTVQRIMRSELSFFKQEGAQPNIALLVDAMEYLKGYPEWVHHPIEDRIYDTMQAVIKDPALLTVLDEIEQQHTQMAALSSVVLNHFYGIMNGQVTPVDQVVGDALDFLTLTEAHLTCENMYLFPAISQYLSDYDLAVIVLELDRQKDPLFSMPRQQVFDHLYETIVTSMDSVVEA